LEIPFGPRDLSFSSCGCVPELVAHFLPSGRSFTARLVQIDEESRRLRMTTHHVFHKLVPEPSTLLGAQSCEVVQHAHGGPFVRVITNLAPEAAGFVFVAKASGDQLGDVAIGSQDTVHLSLPNRTRESWPRDAAVPKSLNDGDEPGQDSILHRGMVTPENLATWFAAVGSHRGARAAIYSLFERSHYLVGIDEAEYRQLEQCVGRNCTGRVIENNERGLELKLTEPSEVSAWMRAEEYSWFCDEQHQNVLVGQMLTVVGTEVDLTGPKIIVSRRRLMPNPYTQYRLGQRVSCTVTKEAPNGAELKIDRLYGWIFAERFPILPQEGLLRSGKVPFDAIIVKVDPDQDGKITVSRRPIVQSLVRTMVSATPLLGRVATIKENGVEILLAPDLKAWMPGEEVSWQRGRVALRTILQENQEITVVLLPQGGNEDVDLFVSRKRVNSGQYVVNGSPGLFFGKQWSKVNAVLEQFRSSGLAAVNVGTVNRDTSGTEILIGADDAPTFYLLVQALGSMASANCCSLSPTSVHRRHEPTRIENLPLPERPKGVATTSTRKPARKPARKRAESKSIRIKRTGATAFKPAQKGKRRLSAAGKAAIIAATKARWAKVKGTTTTPKATKKKDRQSSPVVRAKLAAAERIWKTTPQSVQKLTARSLGFFKALFGGLPEKSIVQRIEQDYGVIIATQENGLVRISGAPVSTLKDAETALRQALE
jgi:hypothetical protein